MIGLNPKAAFALSVNRNKLFLEYNACHYLPSRVASGVHGCDCRIHFTRLFVGQPIRRPIVLEQRKKHLRHIFLPLVRQFFDFPHDRRKQICHTHQL
jgi:hypothetical protein